MRWYPNGLGDYNLTRPMVRVPPTMQAGDPWAHVPITKSRIERGRPGHDPYNHIGRLIPGRYSK